MIGWLLSELSQNPNARFTRAELLGTDSTGCETLRKDGWITAAGLAQTITRDGRLLTITSADDDTHEAFDPDDPEYSEVPIEPAEFELWRPDIGVICEAIREHNDLRGRVGPLGERLWSLGRAARTCQVVLCLVADDRIGLPVISGTPNLLQTDIELVIAVLPAYEPPPAVRRELEVSKVHLAQLDANLNISPDPHAAIAGRAHSVALRDPRTGCAVSAEFRTVMLGDRIWETSRLVGKVVHRLLQAHMDGIPELEQAYVLKEVDSSSRSLAELCERFTIWGTLIVPGNRTGFFRLNL